MLRVWNHIGTNGYRDGLAHLEHHYIERPQMAIDASAMIARILASDAEPLDLDFDPAPLRDLDHARKVARAKAAARPTWEQEKRWFKERLERQRYAAAIGEVLA